MTTATLERPLFRFVNSYARELAGLALPWRPSRVAAPTLLRLKRALAHELGLDADALDGDAVGATG